MNKWEWLKYNVRIIGIQEGKKLADCRRKQQLDIISKINHLWHQSYLDDDSNIELQQLQSKLDDLYTEKAKEAFIRSRARWIEEGEKNSSYFFNLEKNRQTKKAINKLYVNDSLSVDQDVIDNHIFTFFKSLYSSKPSNQETDLFLDLVNN